MQRCLELALMGAGNTAPNPMVGAVLVHNDTIIAEGYHQQYGQAHAEVNCINNVRAENKSLISTSTLYVSLEPCAHFGKTPPCSDLIIQHKIPRVVIGCGDNYKEVNGKGIQKLREAGVLVIEDILQAASVQLNRRFFTFHQQQRPYIILKWAQSGDKKIAHSDHSRVFISNEQTNRLVHKWRTEEAAILVGTNTALHDNPSLTSRLWPGHDPVRLVIDMSLKLPDSLDLLNGRSKTIVFNGIKDEGTGQLLYHKVAVDKPVIPQITGTLYQMNIQSVLVEGGAKLLQSFIDVNLWDEARVITNEQLMIEDGIDAPVLPPSDLVSAISIQSDSIHIFHPVKS